MGGSPLPLSLRRSSEPHCYTLQQSTVFTPRGDEGGLEVGEGREGGQGGQGTWEVSPTVSPLWGNRRPHGRSLSDTLREP